MELLLLLLTGHFITDFYLNPTHWVTCRNKHHIKSPGLWKNVAVHTLLTTSILILSEIALLPAIMSVVLLSFAHFCTNYWQSYRRNSLRYFLIAQTIHIVLIGIIWAYLANFTIGQVAAFLVNILSAKNIIIAMAYLLVCKPASVIISLALKKHTDSLTQYASAITENPTTEKNEHIGLVSAGAWIGYIERCLTISFIFMGQFAGIGFLVATKTIFRFGDLTNNKDMKLTEYMMLGTLLSYAIAIFVGWNVLQVYKIL